MAASAQPELNIEESLQSRVERGVVKAPWSAGVSRGDRTAIYWSDAASEGRASLGRDSQARWLRRVMVEVRVEARVEWLRQIWPSSSASDWDAAQVRSPTTQRPRVRSLADATSWSGLGLGPW